MPLQQGLLSEKQPPAQLQLYQDTTEDFWSNLKKYNNYVDKNVKIILPFYDSDPFVILKVHIMIMQILNLLI